MHEEENERGAICRILADIGLEGLAGIGSYHTDCRLSTGDIGGIREDKLAASM
jgi:hypothetical protein